MSYARLLKEARERKREKDKKITVWVGSATCENAAGALDVYDEMEKHIKASNRSDIYLKRVGCTGRCSLEPIVSVLVPKKKIVTYKQVTKELVHDIFVSHIQGGKVLEKNLLSDSCSLIDNRTKEQKQLEKQPITHEFFEFYADMPFYCKQTRVALRNSGVIDPLSLDEYLLNRGFEAFFKVLEKGPSYVIGEVERSKLRGRGGAGFPTAKKWSFLKNIKEKTRYIICNADEGDPGAFMDRGMLESDPYSVIEGMMIAGFAIGSVRGFFYIRAEYPLAVERIDNAIAVCRKAGLLGSNIFGSGFSFDLEIRLGGGAFVCGEETALIHSIEGDRGQPRIKPPYPAVSGLFEKPTIINNVETLANLPVVISVGGDQFAKIGSSKSGGTKVFAVSGKVKRTGLVEVPIGTSLKEIVFDICGGVPNGKKLKAVQTGGPAGGCIPASLMDTPVDYETLQEVGSIMGSGGLIVLDEDDCIVDIAKFFMQFCQNESCGKCSPCREGTLRMLEILERITSGKGDSVDIDKLNRLALLVQRASLCGLGRAAPHPILSTLKYFRDEYISHVRDKRCPAKKCSALVSYEIDRKKCVGCGACARNCPVFCISGEAKAPHKIDKSRCIKCGRCFEVCKFGAVNKG